MERVAIILRKSSAINRFRRIILDCFASDEFDEHLLCSGFFQERGKYFASSCFATSTPKHPCHKSITVVGVYNKIWSGDFDKFIIGLRNIKCSCGNPLKVRRRKVLRYHWHAKVFVAFKKGAPLIGIIGSSNITGRAFGLLKDWNYEADVVLWNDAHATSKQIIDSALEVTEEDSPAFGVIVSNYAADDPANRGLTMQEKLIKLIEEINQASTEIE
jgi:phosphatidylserine/phosphatidylglycerophosphate/cardiolipin synthase-like enzyme